MLSDKGARGINMLRIFCGIRYNLYIKGRLMYILFFLLIPFVFAYFSCKTDRYLYKTLQTVSCLLIVAAAGVVSGSQYFYYLCAAFLVSIFGDYFLSFKHKNENYFVFGIALYFLAHAGYLLYIVMSFELNILLFAILFAVLVIGYLVYYALGLKKQISGVMVVAVLSYLIISCVVLALSAAAKAPLGAKIPIVSGIALIVISDTIIAETDFREKKHLGKYILPTYYAAQILLSASFIVLNFG